MAVRYHYRVTKFDPSLRDDAGRFPDDLPSSWTSFSDVGGEFGGTRLTLPAYLDVEANHLVAVASFIEESGVANLQAQGVENEHGGFRVVEGHELDAADAVEATRQMLREEGWCRLVAEDFYVHVGWDYYLYVGASEPCEESVRLTESRGLFVEGDFLSPYLDED